MSRSADDQWARVEELFLGALEQPTRDRNKWLHQRCGSNRALRQEVEALLDADGEPECILDQPALTAAEEEPEPASDPMISQRLGPYRVVGRIAEGGMGIVYRAVRDDQRYEAEVAIKVVRRSICTETVRRRFDIECRALACLRNPHIAQLLDAGTTPDGLPYLVMELVEGASLHEFASQRTLSIRDRVKLFVSICRAVHYSHTNLIVHRDLKPSNIVVTEDGTPKLLDFGISKILDEPGEAQHTLTQSRMLTPEYASPEQTRGDAITTATDVYSLGVILFGLFTGQWPYDVESRSLRSVEEAVCRQPAKRPSAVVRFRSCDEDGHPIGWGEVARQRGCTPVRLERSLRGDLDNIVLTALRKEPERRYESALQLAEDLERHLAGLPIRARRDAFAYTTIKLIRRHWLAVAVAAAILVALTIGIISTTRLAQEAESEKEHATIEAESAHQILAFLLEAFLSSRSLSAEEESQVCQAVEQQANQVRRQYETEPHVQANLLDGLGRVALELGQSEVAKSLIDEAYQLRIGTFGAESLEIALSLQSRGDLALSSGDLDRAVSTFRERLRLHRSCPPGVHTDVAVAAHDLARCLHRSGDLEEAERLHREALALRRAHQPRSPLVAESLHDLAAVLRDQGKVDEAAADLRLAIEIRNDVLGPDHVKTLESTRCLSELSHSRPPIPITDSP